MDNEIVFLCETWHKNLKDFEENIYVTDKNCYLRNAKKDIFGQRGRFKGGMAFVVNSKHKVNFTSINERISMLKINKLAVIA